MSATAFLCVTGLMRLYPSARDPRFDPVRNTIAAAPACVPLLWLAMFRPGDLKRQSVKPIDGGPEDAVDALAPIAPVDRAVAQLDAAVAPLEAVLHQPFGPIAKLLGQTLRRAGLAYVTIELDEVEAGRDATAMREDMRRILRFFDAPEREAKPEELVAVLVRMSGPLDQIAHVAGCRHERPVPWE